MLQLELRVTCGRYVDMIVTEGVRGMLRARARMMGSLRRVLERHGFLEVETPVLEASAGGADARPFTTFHNALQQPYVLRIATGAPAPILFTFWHMRMLLWQPVLQ